MPFPILIVEAAFTTNPGATPTWTDISNYVMGISTRRGRTRELDRFRGGTALFRLDNSDRRFDPSNTSSPYYPNVLPMRRIRARATHNAVTYPIYDGYVDSWPLQEWRKEVSEIEVPVTDGFELLGTVDLNITPYVEAVLNHSPAGYWRLNESANTLPVTDSSGFGRNGTFVGGPTLSQPDPITDNVDAGVLLDGVDDYIEFPRSASIVGTGVFSVLLWAKWTAMTTRHIFRQMGTGWRIYADSSGKLGAAGDEGAGTLTPATYNDGNWHLLTFVRQATQWLLYVDAVARITQAFTAKDHTDHFLRLGENNLTDFFAGSVAHPAIINGIALTQPQIQAIYDARNAWAGDLSGTRVGRILDRAGWPATEREVDAGKYTFQSQPVLAGSALDYLQKCAESENGTFFITSDGKVRFRQENNFVASDPDPFGDTGTEYPYSQPQFEFDKMQIRNDIRSQRDGGEEQRASDATSISKYRTRHFARTGLLLNSDSNALSLAQTLLGRYKDPALNVTRIVVHPHRENSNALWAQILGQDLEDRVKINAQPPGGGNAISQFGYVQGVSHDIRTQDWVTTLDIAPESVYGPDWIWGTSRWGESTRWARV